MAAGILVATTPGRTVPGLAQPGTPAGDTAGPAVTGNVTVTTTPVLIAAAPASTRLGMAGWLMITALDGSIYLGGGPDLTPGNGAAVNAPLRMPIFPGDQVYACVASGSASIGVAVTGA